MATLVTTLDSVAGPTSVGVPIAPVLVPGAIPEQDDAQARHA